MNIPAILHFPENNVESQLAAPVTASPSDLFISVTPGEGGKFPQTVHGTVGATDATSPAQILNLAGIAALNVNGRAIQVGDFIKNWTTGAYGYVVRIDNAGDFIETTCIEGGTRNEWNSGDEFSVRPFCVTLNRRTFNTTTNHYEYSTSDMEIVSVKYRVGDDFYLSERAYGETGYVGTLPKAYATGDFASMWVQAQHMHEVGKVLAELEDNKMELDEKRPASIQELTVTDLTVSGTAVIPGITGTGDSDPCLCLCAEPGLEIFPPTITWTPFLDPLSTDCNYYVTRGSTLSSGFGVIATLPPSVTTFTDPNPGVGIYFYRVFTLCGDNDAGKYSNIVRVRYVGGAAASIPCDYFGNGAMGTYTSGNLNRGGVYMYDDWNQSLPMNFQGNSSSLTLVFLTGNMNLNAGGIMCVGPSNTRQTSTTMNVCNTSFDVEVGHGVAGRGGNSGESGTSFPPFPLFYGGGFPATTGGNPGFAGQNGQIYNPSASQGGGAGGTANTGTYSGGGGGGGSQGIAGGPLDIGGYGGVGGRGGSLTSFGGTIMFIVQGSVNLAPGSALKLEGFDGTDGLSGANGGGGFSFQTSTGGGAGAGGGGGGAGSDGSKVIILHRGGFTSNAIIAPQGGNGGVGGAPGIGGPPGSGGGAYGQTGLAGTNGGSGANGQFINSSI